MVGRAHVCAEREGISCASTEHSARYDRRKWLRRLFVRSPENYSLRRYDDEQWDVMFFLQGTVEMICAMCVPAFPSASCVSSSMAIIIAAATMSEWSFHPASRTPFAWKAAEDVIMVYGTSTIFQPEFEGRIVSDVESAELPESWRKFRGRGD